MNICKGIFENLYYWAKSYFNAENNFSLDICAI